MQRILLIDDERSFVRGLMASLRQAGYEVVPAYDGEQGLLRFQEGRPDLVLLDIMLPGVDGLSLCQRIRQQGNTPVIMLTARADDVDKILGLELGADDYITKPFNARELMARIKAVLRRTGASPDGRVLHLGRCEIDLARQAVSCEKRPVALTPKEYDLIAFLAMNAGRVFTRDDLLARVWGYEFPGDDRTVDVHIRRLREKLETDPAAPALILTRWGRGYYLEPTSGGVQGEG